MALAIKTAIVNNFIIEPTLSWSAARDKCGYFEGQGVYRFLCRPTLRIWACCLSCHQTYEYSNSSASTNSASSNSWTSAQDFSILKDLSQFCCASY